MNADNEKKVIMYSRKKHKGKGKEVISAEKGNEVFSADKDKGGNEQEQQGAEK